MAAEVTERPEIDQHSVPQHAVTHAQLTLFIAYLISLALWMLHSVMYLGGMTIFGRSISANSDILNNCINECANKTSNQQQSMEKSDIHKVHLENGQSDKDILSTNTKIFTEDFSDSKCQTGESGENKKLLHSSFSPINQYSKCAQDPTAVCLNRFLSSMMVFGLILFYFYLCDYVKIFPQGERVYSRDTFLFLVFIFFLTGCAFTLKTNADKILNREQTEEWKGWMQVMFVWYHYFMAKEWYNWIRVYIACYVWMTGFGNFSFFWIRNDYSMWRLLKMLFRLNFLVIFVSMVTNNEFMLYYICAMHTYWFLSVYLFMRILCSWNRNSYLMAIKFIAYAGFNALIFDIPGMTYYVFRPLYFILGYHDNSTDTLHEWSFRAGLDHWACFVGMLCAYNYPHFETLMKYLDSDSISKQENVKKMTIRTTLIIACVVWATTWYFVFMRQDKYTYNSTHPYTSMIPIIIYIVMRNIHPVVRSYHVHMFAWLGKITLETYLSQLHIYLLSNARTLLILLAGYPLLNFSLTTIMYLFVSHTLFTITNDFSNYLIPNDPRQLQMNMLYIAVIFGVSAFLAYGIFVF